MQALENLGYSILVPDNPQPLNHTDQGFLQGPVRSAKGQLMMIIKLD